MFRFRMRLILKEQLYSTVSNGCDDEKPLLQASLMLIFMETYDFRKKTPICSDYIKMLMKIFHQICEHFAVLPVYISLGFN